MKFFKPLIALGMAACSFIAAHAGPTPSILSIKDSIHDTTVTAPESFETDVKKMQEEWYLRNFAELDRNADAKPSVPTTDQQYIQRLKSLPAAMELPYNKVVKGFIEMYADRRKQLVENMLGMSLYYMPIFTEALERHGVPLELRYLPVIESALNPSAVSKAGAAGLWQFMPGTGSQFGLELNSLVDQRRDPYLSSDAAARYLKQLYSTFGDWSLAIAAYNCGPGNVIKARRRAGNNSSDFWEIYRFLPSETRGYVPAFIAANYVMNYYDQHNISPALARKPIVTDTVHINRRIHFEQISDVLNIPMDEIRALNPQYRRDVIPGDIKPYALVLPSLQIYAYIANEDSIAAHRAAEFARRDVVEPAEGNVAQDADGRKYVDETVVKYHKVGRGETVNSIAQHYGVSAAGLRKANGLSKKARVKRGQRLKVYTTRRKYIDDTEVKPEENVEEEVVVDEVVDTADDNEAEDPEADNAPAEDDGSEDDAADAPATVPAAPAKPAAEPAKAVPAAPAKADKQQAEVPAPKQDSKKVADEKAAAEKRAAEKKAADEKAAKERAEREKAEKERVAKEKAEKRAAEKKAAEEKAAKERAERKKAQSHTVKNGESPAKIAKKYGVTTEEILEANGLKAGDKIQPGDKIKIPAKESKSSKSGKSGRKRRR